MVSQNGRLRKLEEFVRSERFQRWDALLDGVLSQLSMEEQDALQRSLEADLQAVELGVEPGPLTEAQRAAFVRFAELGGLDLLDELSELNDHPSY